MQPYNVGCLAHLFYFWPIETSLFCVRNNLVHLEFQFPITMWELLFKLSVESLLLNPRHIFLLLLYISYIGFFFIHQILNNPWKNNTTSGLYCHPFFFTSKMWVNLLLNVDIIFSKFNAQISKNQNIAIRQKILNLICTTFFFSTVYFYNLMVSKMWRMYEY
jgi:hypothetical protein